MERFLKIVLAVSLAACLLIVWELAEIALYGIHQQSIIDPVAAGLVATGWVRWMWSIWRADNGTE